MDSQKKFVIILVRQPQLGQTLQRAQFEAFRQRIATTLQVMWLESAEITTYVAAKLKVAGVTEPLFSPEIIETIAASAGTSIQKINRLLTQCLIRSKEKTND
ncbi:hypothetical protein [uncultured Vagococcus sp.]|uniref:hypothetical protein n=1 Tax=uncultured Vagococcus sp. TaxID=189676 RepID=UPI0028D18EAA|nr:hypothetical protein [uncultured Vagococcus sp.]